MSPLRVNLVRRGLPDPVQVGLIGRAPQRRRRGPGTTIAGAPLVLATSDAERRRTRLVAVAVTVAGTFLIAVQQMLQLAWQTAASPIFVTMREPDGTLVAVQQLSDRGTYEQGLADYLANPGQIVGASMVPAFLALTVMMFAVQALRIGTVARERRLAALSIAGATRRQLRGLAVREGTRAAVRGAVLAGPGYLLVWLVLGVLMPRGHKLLPSLDRSVYLAWAVGVVVLAAAGGVAAALSARTVQVSPLGITRRAPRPVTWRSAAVPVVSVVAAAGPWVVGWSYGGGIDWPLLGSLGAAAVFAISAGPVAVVGIARLALRSERLSTSMAARRLLADPRPAGRVTGVIFAVGLTLGFAAWFSADILHSRDSIGMEVSFYLGGVVIVAVAAVLAALVACAAMVTAASEQVLEGRRGVAVLVSLAASPDFVQGLLRRQLSMVAVPAALAGAVVGMLAFADSDPVAVVEALPALLVVYGLARAAAALAARAVGPVVRECSGPENLRAA